MLNLGNYTMKPLCGTDNTAPHYYPNFCGATEVFRSKFLKTQAQIMDEFAKDTASQGIAGALPPYWLAKLEGKPQAEKEAAIKKIFLLFRAAIKHLKPYNAPPNSKVFNQHKVNMENVRRREASEFLTKGLRHFGIIPETNSVSLKKLKVKGSYTKGAYVLKEKGENPTLEKLFIKIFKEKNKYSLLNNEHGKYAELAHGLYLTSTLKSKNIVQTYWGDTQAGYMSLEYITPPKHVSPIVQLKKQYEDIYKFATDFYNQTGIKLKELVDSKINIGKTENGCFIPHSKEHIVTSYLQSILQKMGLYHTDLHNQNAIIGSTKTGQPILKIIDIGGIG